MSIGTNHQKEIDVNIQSQTNQYFQYYLLNELKTDITLTAELAEDAETVSVSAGHGFIDGLAGQYIVIRNGDEFEQCEVKSVSGNNIGLCMPTARSYPVATTTIIRGSNLTNVNGSVTPVDFKLTMVGASIPIDLGVIKMGMQSGATVPDNGTFGGITKLTNGSFFRKINGSKVNLGNYRSNQDFKDRGAKVDYPQKAPSGTYTTDIEFDLEQIFGSVQRISPAEDVVVYRVRDDCTGNSDSFVSLIGSYTSGE